MFPDPFEDQRVDIKKLIRDEERLKAKIRLDNYLFVFWPMAIVAFFFTAFTLDPKNWLDALLFMIVVNFIVLKHC